MDRLLRAGSFGLFMLAIYWLIAPYEPHAQTATASPPLTRESKPANVLLLGAAATGVIGRILVPEGGHVEAGQIILQIDCRPLEAEIEVRESNLKAAEAAFERARNGSRVEDIAIGEANVGVALARAEEARDAFGRATALTEGLTITHAQVLQVQRDARVTAAQLEDAKKRLALLKAGFRQEDIDEAHAKRDEANASFAEAKAQLEQCSVHAPVAGLVHMTATLGQLVSTYAPATLVQLTEDKQK